MQSRICIAYFISFVVVVVCIDGVTCACNQPGPTRRRQHNGESWKNLKLLHHQQLAALLRPLAPLLLCEQLALLLAVAPLGFVQLLLPALLPSSRLLLAALLLQPPPALSV
jgi:hypothetical protein